MGKDIFDAIAEFRVAFASLDLNPPDVILLKSPEDGMRVLSELRQEHLMTFAAGSVGQPVEHPDGSVWIEIEVYGMKIRWPAKKYATHDGGFKWQ